MKSKIINILKIGLLGIIPIMIINKNFIVGTSFDKYGSIIMILLLFYNLYSYKNFTIKKSEIKENVFLFYLSIMYSIFINFGLLIDRNYNDYTFDIFQNIFSLIGSILAIGIVVFPVIKKIYFYTNSIKNSNNYYKHRIVYTIIIFVVIFASWVPYLINYYPGLMSPDSLNQWAQASGVVSLSNHHPIAHTMLIKIFYMIGKMFNNANIGVCCYSIFQMLVMSLAFSYSLNYLMKKNVRPIIIFVITGIFMFVPIFGMYAVTMWKDVLFGVGCLIVIIQLYKYLFESKFSILDKILLITSIIWVGLFRTNGLYVVLVLAVLLFFLLKGKRKTTFIIVMVPALCSLLIVGPVYNAFGINKTEFTENVGILTKQVYGVMYANIDISSTEKKYFEKLVDTKEALSIYDPYTDHIKSMPSYSNEFLEKNKISFFKNWLTIGLKNPKTYLNVYFKATYGFWYPEATGYITHQWEIAENDLNISSTNRFNYLKCNEYFSKFYSTNIIKYLLSDAFYFWITLMVLVFALIRKEYKKIIPLSLIILVWGTLMIATPLAYQPRYAFANYCCLPIIILLAFKNYEGDIYHEKKIKKARNK